VIALAVISNLRRTYCHPLHYPIFIPFAIEEIGKEIYGDFTSFILHLLC
jgi:hypothetical protein